MSKKELENTQETLDQNISSIGYQHKEHDPKWAKRWREDEIYKTEQNSTKPKSYILDMFPYPSGAGLHVGHVEGYTATDILSRYKRMKGYEVLHPMGWDAFGLPTENYAIKTGKNPVDVTRENTDTFRTQCNMAGFSYDWDREVDTSDPNYYKWTQWIFLKMYDAKLAFKEKASANWCPACQTVIANSEAKEGYCDRCNSMVETKKIEQWFYKTTAYADKLIKDLDEVDWPQSSKQAQRKFIGRSEGHEITFPIEGASQELKIFTTRVDTIHGTTFMAIAPESDYIETLVTEEYRDQVEKYIRNIAPQSKIERSKADKEKTGVFTGSYAINPINGEKIPIWVADYVLMDYGTGAIMGVPSLDDRDLDFAKTHNLSIVDVPADLLTDDGTKRTINALGEAAKAQVQYKLRNWGISRERYWGAPIPIVYCPECGIQPVKEEQLPVILPTDIEDYKPTGVPPLTKSPSFMETTCPKCDGPAQREAKTMDTFVDSSWYFLRYCDPTNNQELVLKEAAERWMPVDIYLGGTEHLTGHLIYARFITKALKDLGIIDINEPFSKLVHQGMILGTDGKKMSKSTMTPENPKGNIVNPEEIIEPYGIDTLRITELFLGPLDQAKSWKVKIDKENNDRRIFIDVEGIRHFIDRVNSLTGRLVSEEPDPELISLTDNLVRNVGEGIEAMKFNVTISEFMKYITKINIRGSIDKISLEKFLITLAPFAPFVTEQLWSEIGNQYSIHQESWPEIKHQDKEQTTNKIALQVNGKLRSVIVVDRQFTGTKEDVINVLANDARLAEKVSIDAIKNIIYKPGKVLNIVISNKG